MNLKISVDYYNSDEAELFQGYPNYELIQRKLNSEFVISENEFRTYLIFTEQADEAGWRTYRELKERFESRLGDIEDILEFNNGSIQTKLSSSRMHNAGMTERIGVSLGLSVVNQFHGLTEADWAITDDVYIEGVRQKDFDYEINIASDGVKYIQVENKGAICDDNRYKNPSISNHYRSISEKKTDVLNLGIISNNRNQNILYGTIGVLDRDNIAKVWLVDPLPYKVKWNPKKFKLISRLSFYLNLFNTVGVHKRIIKSLDKRIAELLNAEDIDQFNKVRLDNGDKILQIYFDTKNFVKINTNEAFGTFFILKFKNKFKVFIVAITMQIIKLIINQDFEQILNYEYKNADLSEKAIVELSASLSGEIENIENSKVSFLLDEKKKKYFAQIYSKLNVTSSGRIFGLIG